MSTRNAGKVSAAVMASRVLGLLREMMFASLFGGSRWMDCFNLAFRVPNLLRDLFAEGALSQAFVTTFSKKLKTEGDVPAWELANKMLTLAAVFMAVVSLIGVIAAPWIVDLLTLLPREGSAASSPAELAAQVDFTVMLVRVMYPFILLVSLAALVMGMLNAKNVFGVPALSSCFFNLGSMIGGAAIGWWIDPAFGKNSLIGFACGVVIGGLAQLVFQFPALARTGYRFVFDFGWNDSGVKKILQLMGPAVIAASVTQINVVINSMFAFGVGEGAVSWLGYAFRLMQLPIGVFGVAVATVTLPALSRAAAEGITPEFRTTLAKGLRLVVFLVLPSTIGLVILAEPIISVIFERGKFDAADRIATAGALRAYGCGLLFYAALKVIQPAFYAIDRRWLPMICSILALLLNISLNWFFVYRMRWGHESLALTTSIIAILNFLFLYVAMHIVGGGLDTRSLVTMTLKTLIAGSVMGGVCFAANHWVFRNPVELPILIRLVCLIATVGFAAVVYYGATWVLRIPEATEAAELLRRRLKR